MGILFFLFWIILNGRVTPEIIIFGLVISSSVYLFSYRFLDYDPRAELRLAARIPMAVWIFFVLIGEIVKATLTMIGYIFNFRDIPEPCVVHFRTPLRTDLARYALATFITLTPGTITVRLRDGEFQVHCYDREMAREIDSSVFVRLLMKMEGGQKS
jgi:multicomponent Na+:H+ antiporter subunit E